MRLCKLLTEKDWQIICASPPGGTDSRFRKCLLPRRDLKGSVKGLRDEVDLTAHDREVLLLVECKPRLSDSLSLLNALGETDHRKLQRISNSFGPSRLAMLIRQAVGTPVPEDPLVALALAVGVVDCEVPTDVSVIELGSLEYYRTWTVEPLKGRLQ